jgi:hypothetical protein
VSIVGAGDPATQLDTVFDNGLGSVTNRLAQLLPNTISIKAILIQLVKPVGVVQQFNPVTAVGTGGVASLPQQVAVILTRKTATPGRGGRGRLFVGPIPTALQSGADPNQVNIANYQFLATAALASLSQGGFTFVPVLWRRKANVSVDITSWNINPIMKTRRSRAEGVRFHRRKRRTVGSI